VAETYQYVCEACSFEVLSGCPCAECPYCGGDLRLLRIANITSPAPPPVDRRIETEMDDVLRGFARLLEEADQ
jgi:hypothetical protein